MVKRLFRSVTKWILSVLKFAKGPAFVVVVILGLLSLLSSASFTFRVPIKPFIVLSGSMRPTIPEGSVVFVDRKTQQFGVGDVVTFLRPGNARENVTHRIASIEEKDGKTLYKTKGDANNAKDLWSVRREAVWGKVMFSLPLLGYVVSFTKTRPGVLLVVVLPLAIIAIDELRVIISEIKKIRQKKKNKQKASQTATIVSLLIILSYTVFASQLQTTIGGFSDTLSSTNQQISTSCWETPVAPTLMSPVNNHATADADATFTWNSSTSTCPTATLAYNFQLYSDAGLTTLEDESGFGSAISYTYVSIPEGEYWWRVESQDQYGNTSESTAYHLIIDRTVPTVSLSVTGSWLREVSETVGNGDFETGDASNWTSTGTVSVISSDSFSDPDTTVVPYEGSWMAKIGDTADPGNYVWENRLMRSFAAGAKSLSFYYNFWSRDNSADLPGFFVRLNGQEVFRRNDLGSDLTNALSTGWQQFIYDLSSITTSQISLGLYAGNTGDTGVQSWVYVDKISTYFVTAPSHATYTISGTDLGSGIDHYEHSIDLGGWTTGDTFTVPAGGTHTISYRSVDAAGNAITQIVTLITDATAPSAISDLGVSTTENSAVLTWTAPANDDGATSGRAASYDVRYSDVGSASDCSAFSFPIATSVNNPPAPQDYGTGESMEIVGLNPATNYCFAITSSDEAPNTSVLSNVVFATTLAGAAVNPGDVVINELFWMGSSVSPLDEWLELRNMTDHPIDLTGLILKKLSGGIDVDMGIDFTGKTIGPYGYFLIANGNNYGGVDSQLKDSITPNIIDGSLTLSNTTLQIKLMDGITVIDVAWDGTVPTEGIYDTTPGSEKYYSMERISTSSNGANPLEWYTTIDAASTTDFFEGTSDERGTPGAANRSENEPLAHQRLIVRSIGEPIEATTAAETAVAVSEITDAVATDSGNTVEPAISEEQESSPAATIVPESTPQVTLEPSPTVQPTAEPTPEPTPTPTLQPSTTPTPESTPQPPEVTPEPTPEPTPTLEVTPTPTASSDVILLL